MKTKILILVFLFCANSLYAQYFWIDQMQNLTNARLNSVSYYYHQNIWICGDSGKILRSTELGYSWFLAGGNGVPDSIPLNHIAAIDTHKVLVTGVLDSVAYVYRTSNSGLNWITVFSQPNGFINGIYINDSMQGCMIGNPVDGRWSVWRTANGGINWDSSGVLLLQAGNEYGFNNSVYGTGNKIWFGTNNNRIYYSNNLGINWDSVTISSPSTSVVYFKPDSTNTGYSGGVNLFRTYNGGLNWSLVNLPGTGLMSGYLGLGFLGEQYWCIRSNDNNIYHSYDGNNWMIQYTAPSGYYTHIAKGRIFYPYMCIAFAVRNNGGISQLFFILNAVTKISNEIPSKYVFYQNYPNPFNSTTKFKFENPALPGYGKSDLRGGFIRLIIYNTLGQEVGSLINEVLQPGVYYAEWNGNNFPSGIYFYRFIVTDPNSSTVVHSETRKMALIK